jgi:predicted 2-oxoglutarate/Fe(II)-dependent dioxygenase YbiX
LTASRLEAFKLGDFAPSLVACTPERSWMDAFPNRHAYRCLPLTIANTHGWELLAPAAFEVTWNGGSLTSDLTVQALEPFPDRMPLEHFAVSNFGRGVVTFHTGYLFRTPPGWNLLATGALNEPRPGISPLVGIIETDWLPYSFTQNWQMLGSGTVRFEKDEVYCTIMPIPKDYLGDWQVAVHAWGDDPVLSAEEAQFRASRIDFQARMDKRDPAAIKEAWQRHYFVGRHPDGTENADHVNKLRLRDPVDLSGTRPLLARDASQSPTATATLAAGADRWTPGSPLADMEHGETEANRIGRTRLRDGALTPSEVTTTITPDMDPEAFDFVYEPSFLSPAECALLVEAANGLAAQQKVEGITEDFWKGRILFLRDVARQRSGAAAVMRDAQRRVTQRLRRFYELTAPLFADTVQLVRWRQGMSMPPHADRANPDGSPHQMPFRVFASIVYLNDDYEGGELYFPRLDLVVRPGRGMLLAFTGGWHHEHAVLTVLQGDRLTMPAFYTFDASWRDRDVYDFTAAEA